MGGRFARHVQEQLTGGREVQGKVGDNTITTTFLGEMAARYPLNHNLNTLQYLYCMQPSDSMQVCHFYYKISTDMQK